MYHRTLLIVLALSPACAAAVETPSGYALTVSSDFSKDELEVVFDAVDIWAEACPHLPISVEITDGPATIERGWPSFKEHHQGQYGWTSYAEHRAWLNVDHLGLWTEQFLPGVARHEIGHLLGMRGHLPAWGHGVMVEGVMGAAQEPTKADVLQICPEVGRQSDGEPEVTKMGRHPG